MTAPDGMRTPVPAGLCGHCRHARPIRSDRGSAFILCGRSKSDPRYARYPRLPVSRCPGYEPLVPGGEDPRTVATAAEERPRAGGAEDRDAPASEENGAPG